MPLILAVDPGIKGAVVLYDTAQADRLLRYWPMPTDIVQKSQAKKPSPAVSVMGIVKLFREIALVYDVALFVPEKVGGMPKQSAPSAFAFGAGYGALLACGAMNAWPVHEVPPATWKKELKAPKDKIASVAFACNLFPASADTIQKAAAGLRAGGNADEGGCAEAGLLALYAARRIL